MLWESGRGDSSPLPPAIATLHKSPILIDNINIANIHAISNFYVAVSELKCRVFCLQILTAKNIITCKWSFKLLQNCKSQKAAKKTLSRTVLWKDFTSVLSKHLLAAVNVLNYYRRLNNDYSRMKQTHRCMTMVMRNCLRLNKVIILTWYFSHRVSEVPQIVSHIVQCEDTICKTTSANSKYNWKYCHVLSYAFQPTKFVFVTTERHGFDVRKW